MKRRQTVPQQRKWHYYFEDWGCLICETTTELHSGLGMCFNCHHRIADRLQRSIARRDTDPEAPVFNRNIKLAREALAPSMKLLKGTNQKTKREDLAAELSKLNASKEVTKGEKP